MQTRAALLPLLDIPRGRVCGVDEAGRGPLAGPVVAAAVILSAPLPGLADSKTISAATREALRLRIIEQAISWGIGVATVAEIDALNILNATHLAMRRAVVQLAPSASAALVDGNRLPVLPCPSEAIVQGDAQIAPIAAAAILAKTTRDRLMIDLDRLYPAYGFAVHKGYPTRAHLAALAAHGPCPIHRLSFAPVKAQSRPVSAA